MSIKAESIKAALAAYEIERDCIDKMRDYFNETEFSKAVDRCHVAGGRKVPEQCNVTSSHSQ